MFRCTTILVLVVSLFTANVFANSPSKPEVEYQIYSETAAELFWSRSTDDTLVISYEIVRNGNTLATLDALSYFDDSLTTGEQYTYSVTAIDTHGNRSMPTTVELSTGTNSTVVSSESLIANESISAQRRSLELESDIWNIIQLGSGLFVTLSFTSPIQIAPEYSALSEIQKIANPIGLTIYAEMDDGYPSIVRGVTDIDKAIADIEYLVNQGQQESMRTYSGSDIASRSIIIGATYTYDSFEKHQSLITSIAGLESHAKVHFEGKGSALLLTGTDAGPRTAPLIQSRISNQSASQQRDRRNAPSRWAPTSTVTVLQHDASTLDVNIWNKWELASSTRSEVWDRPAEAQD